MFAILPLPCCLSDYIKSKEGGGPPGRGGGVTGDFNGEGGRRRRRRVLCEFGVKGNEGVSRINNMELGEGGWFLVAESYFISTESVY